MVTCKDCVNLLLEYLEGRLDKPTTVELEQHLEDCPPCQTFAATYQRIPAMFREVECDDIPEELRSRLHSFLINKIQNPDS